MLATRNLGADGMDYLEAPLHSGGLSGLSSSKPCAVQLVSSVCVCACVRAYPGQACVLHQEPALLE